MNKEKEMAIYWPFCSIHYTPLDTLSICIYMSCFRNCLECMQLGAMGLDEFLPVPCETMCWIDLLNESNEPRAGHSTVVATVSECTCTSDQTYR